MDSPNNGASSSDVQPNYRPGPNYAKGRGKLVAEQEKPYKDLREVLNKKRHENDSRHSQLQMPPNPKYNFLADPLRDNNYTETEDGSATLNDKEFNSGSYPEKKRGNNNLRWNRGGRGSNYNRTNYNNYQQNTARKNKESNIENSEIGENFKQSQHRSNPRPKSYKRGENFLPKYSSDQAQNDDLKTIQSKELAESGNVMNKFRGSRSYRDQEQAESGVDGESFGKTRFVKGRHSFRDNTTKEEFTDRESVGKNNYRGGRYSFRENSTREHVSEGDDVGRRGFRRGSSFRDTEYSDRTRFERGRRPYRGNYRGNNNRGRYNNNRIYRNNTRDGNPTNISVEFSVETGDRKCTMEPITVKKNKVKNTSDKVEDVVVACEENWDEDEQNCPDGPEEEISLDNLCLDDNGRGNPENDNDTNCSAIKCDTVNEF